MICMKVNIPPQLCEIDDELKAIYHSNKSICIWLFKTRSERNRFLDETVSMNKTQREAYYLNNFEPVYLDIN